MSTYYKINNGGLHSTTAADNCKWDMNYFYNYFEKQRTYLPTVITNKLIIKSNDTKEEDDMTNKEVYDKMKKIYMKYMKIITEDLTAPNKTETKVNKTETRLAIKRVIYYDNRITAVRWKDNSETIIRVQDGDQFSEETGLALCICKKLLGKNFYEEFETIIDKAYRVDTKKRKADKKMKKELAKKRAEEERRKKKNEKKVVNDKVVDNKKKTTKKKILIE